MDKKELDKSAVIYTSDRDIMLEKAKGPYIWDDKGKKYLDFAAAIAVNSLGNVNPKLVKAVKAQMDKLGQTSMSHNTKILEETSRLMIDQFDKKGKVFWTNSGAEANECAMKAMYFYQHSKGRKERDTIISFEGSFHGRTMRTLAPTGKYMEGMGPVPKGFKIIPYNDVKALKAAIDKRTAGILVEPLQGEGGIIVPSQKFMDALRKLADKHDLVLTFDEVQAGLGRTGKFFAYENSKIKPDIICLAKALSGGVIPVAATLLSAKIANELTANNTRKFSNGTTFGGNPLALTAAGKALEMLLKKDNEFTGKEAKKVAKYLYDQLTKLSKEKGMPIKEVRGLGFMLGIQLTKDTNSLQMVGALRENGLFAMPAGDNVVRFVPPLNIKKKHVDEAIKILRKTLKQDG